MYIMPILHGSNIIGTQMVSVPLMHTVCEDLSTNEPVKKVSSTLHQVALLAFI